MNANASPDLQLRTDFAARVLEAADHLLARRRRHRWMAGASTLCTAIAAVVMWLDLSAAPQGPGQNPNLFAAAGTTVSSRGGSPDALSWLFPDAEPLARYAAEDAPDDNGDGAGALFTDDD